MTCEHIGTVTVANRRAHRPTPGDVYIGRPGPFGNPYVVGRDGARGECVGRFEAHLRREWVARGPLRQLIIGLAERLNRGEDLTLICFCAPRPCHGDVLARAITKTAQVLRGRTHPQEG